MGDTWTTELQKSLDQSSVAAEAQTRDHSLVCKLDNLGTIVPCAMVMYILGKVKITKNILR